MKNIKEINMKKFALLAAFVFISSSFALPADFSIHANINYSFGLNDFFDLNQVTYSFDGKNYLDKTRNKMGLGFNVGLNIPLSDKLFLTPAYSFQFGHQKFESVNLGDSREDNRKNSYFNITSGELTAGYNFLEIQQTWLFSAHLGLNYNWVKADKSLNLTDTYWGWHGGLSARFQELKRLGFQLSAILRMPFSNAYYTILVVQAGIIYYL